MENVTGGAGMPKKKKIQRKSIDKTKTIPKPKASIEGIFLPVLVFMLFDAVM